MSMRYFICFECGHKFESEEGKPQSEDPQECPACHSANITVYAVRLTEENPVPASPASGCNAPTGST